MQFKKELFVFPTSRAIREFIKEEKLNNTLLPTFLSIDEFLKKAVSINEKEYIDEEQRFLYLKEAASIDGLKKLGFSSSFSDFIKHSDYLFRFYGEMAAEKVNIKDIKTADTYEYYFEHLEVLETIYKNYLNLLNKNSAVDKINFSSNYNINSNFVKKFKEITIVFEGYFTSVEFDIIKEVAKNTTLFIKLKYNEYNKKSLEKFLELGFDLELNHNYVLNVSSKKICSKESIDKKVQNMQIEAFSSRVNQISFIKNSIVTMINKGISKDKIVLVLPNESMKDELILFDDERYFNYAMGKDIKASVLYQRLNALNNYLNEEENKDIDFLKFVNINKEEVDLQVKPIWNKVLKEESFDAFIKFCKEEELNLEILEKFEELIYKIKYLFFKKVQHVSLKEAIKILLQKVNKITLDDVNAGAITVMGLLETRAISYDGVIICDFNESFVPKRSVKDKFLSSKIKAFSKLPTSYDRENLQKYYYTSILNSAKEVAISYVQSETMQISRFANELFTKEKISYNVKDDEYKHILYKNKKLQYSNQEIILEIDLSQNTWSATSLKTFLDCKRKYYLHYIISLKEHTSSLKPKAYELGSIIHKILEMLYSSNKEITYENLLTYFNEYKNINAFLKLDLEIWKLKLKDYIKNEQSRMKESFSVFALEKSFLFEHRGIKLKGVIDRIDKINDTYEIIDYKTSSTLKVDTAKTYEKSKDFQLEFYFLASKDLLKSSKIKTYYYDLHENRLKEELCLEQKLSLLDEIFDDLHTSEVNFEKCEEKITCQFCSYKIICDR